MPGRLEADGPWIELLMALTSAKIEGLGTREVLDVNDLWRQVNRHLKDNPALNEMQQEMMTTYREALRVVGTIWQIQGERVLEEVDFLLRNAPPLPPVEKSEKDEESSP